MRFDDFTICGNVIDLGETMPVSGYCRVAPLVQVHIRQSSKPEVNAIALVVIKILPGNGPHSSQLLGDTTPSRSHLTNYNHLCTVTVPLSIIIVSYNVRYFLEQCLLSVRRAATRGMEAEVIVVDNQSADGTTAYLQPLFPEVMFLDAGANLGFARACNLGFHHAGGEHILFLNPDTLLGEDSLERVLAFVRTHPHAGAVGVRMVDGNGRFLKESKRGFPGPLPSLFKLCGLASLFPRSALFSRYYLGHLSAAQNQEIDVVAGAFMLIPRPVLEKVGLFDEAFFMYGEDIDLSYRIQQEGYRNYYVAGAAIVHFKGESTRRQSARHVHTFYKAMDLFVRKHFTGMSGSAFGAVLRLAIWLRAGVSLAAAAVGPLRWPEPGSQQLPVAIFADDDNYATLVQAFESRGTRTTRLQQLAEARVLEKGQQLVLCTSRQTLSQYLQWMGGQHLELRYLFHLQGSGSIVGSPRASGKGCAIALPSTAGRHPKPFNLVN